MYAQIVVDHRPQNYDKNGVKINYDKNDVKITAGRNLIQYPIELNTTTIGMRTSTLMWNNTISTRGARYMVAGEGIFTWSHKWSERSTFKLQLC